MKKFVKEMILIAVAFGLVLVIDSTFVGDIISDVIDAFYYNIDIMTESGRDVMALFVIGGIVAGIKLGIEHVIESLRNAFNGILNSNEDEKVEAVKA